MELTVDGIIYLYQKYGGISQLFTEVLPRMCDLEPEMAITLLIHPKGSPGSLLNHEHIIHQTIPDVHPFLRPHRLLDPYYLQVCQLAVRPSLGKSKEKIWLSTYYTSPICWSGPQVLVAHDFIYEKYRNKYWKNESVEAEETIRNKKFSVSNADLVICVSEATRQDLLVLYHVPIHKTAVVHLSHKSSFTLLNGIADENEKEFFLYVGNRNQYKDFDLLIKSYANWPGRFEIGLVCAGGGKWIDAERKLMVDLGVDNLIALIPHVDDLHLCRLYNKALAFIYPSQSEGFGIPLLEAMACGCPIVASRIPAFVEVASDVPIYFAPGKKDELIVALDQAKSEGRMSKRTDKGLARVNQFSWENTAQGFLQAFRSLV